MNIVFKKGKVLREINVYSYVYRSFVRFSCPYTRNFFIFFVKNLENIKENYAGISKVFEFFSEIVLKFLK